MFLKKTSFVIKDLAKDDPAAALAAALLNIDPAAKVRITIEVMDDITRFKKRYFAMVTELAKYAGYHSYKDREIFKRQLRDEIGIRSMTDIDTTEEASLAIEAVHQIAAEFYHYKFTPDGESFQFDNKEGGGE